VSCEKKSIITKPKVSKKKNINIIKPKVSSKSNIIITKPKVSWKKIENTWTNQKSFVKGIIHKTTITSESKSEN
jgi:hypothetical protein